MYTVEFMGPNTRKVVFPFLPLLPFLPPPKDKYHICLGLNKTVVSPKDKFFSSLNIFQEVFLLLVFSLKLYLPCIYLTEI